MAFHLLDKIVARFFVGKIETVFIYQHFLQFEPFLPRLFRHVVEYALSELAGIWGKIKPFRCASKLDAFDCSGHFDCYRAVLQICYMAVSLKAVPFYQEWKEVRHDRNLQTLQEHLRPPLIVVQSPFLPWQCRH